MKTIEQKKHHSRKKRALRVRKKLRGTSIKPRLSVTKSNSHVYAQLIDDEAGVTIASASTLSKELKGSDLNKKSKVSAKKLGEAIAEMALKKSVKECVFDRGPHKYHGVLAELADGARGSGLKF